MWDPQLLPLTMLFISIILIVIAIMIMIPLIANANVACRWNLSHRRRRLCRMNGLLLPRMNAPAPPRWLAPGVMMMIMMPFASTFVNVNRSKIVPSCSASRLESTHSTLSRSCKRACTSMDWCFSSGRWTFGAANRLPYFAWSFATRIWRPVP